MIQIIGAFLQVVNKWSQLSIGAFAIYAKQLFPTSQVIVAVSFPQPANGEAAIYEDFFNCPVTFDALSTANTNAEAAFIKP